MGTAKAGKTIAQVFEEFLADQAARISHKSCLKYQSIIGLYKSYLESYWPGRVPALRLATSAVARR